MQRAASRERESRRASGPLGGSTNHCPVAKAVQIVLQVCKNYRIPSLITLFGQQSGLETDRHVHCNDHIIGKKEKGPAELMSIAITNRFLFWHWSSSYTRRSCVLPICRSKSNILCTRLARNHDQRAVKFVGYPNANA